jgi:hypothetical protein
MSSAQAWQQAWQIVWQMVLRRMEEANAGKITRVMAEMILNEYFDRLEAVVIEHSPKGD